MFVVGRGDTYFMSLSYTGQGGFVLLFEWLKVSMQSHYFMEFGEYGTKVCHAKCNASYVTVDLSQIMNGSLSLSL